MREFDSPTKIGCRDAAFGLRRSHQFGPLLPGDLSTLRFVGERACLWNSTLAKTSTRLLEGSPHPRAKPADYGRSRSWAASLHSANVSEEPSCSGMESCNNPQEAGTPLPLRWLPKSRRRLARPALGPDPRRSTVRPPSPQCLPAFGQGRVPQDALGINPCRPPWRMISNPIAASLRPRPTSSESVERFHRSRNGPSTSERT
jgi:hypothetical protein